MVCLRYISVNTLHKGDNNDDDDDGGGGGGDCLFFNPKPLLFSSLKSELSFVSILKRLCHVRPHVRMK